MFPNYERYSNGKYVKNSKFQTWSIPKIVYIIKYLHKKLK